MKELYMFIANKLKTPKIKNKRKYIKRAVRVYSFAVFLMVVAVMFISHLIIEANESKNEDIIRDTLFLTGVETFENTYKDFFAVVDVLKSENALSLFTIVDKEVSIDIVDELRKTLIDFTDLYSQIGAKFIVYRTDADLAVSRAGESDFEEALESLDVASREIKVVIEYLHYSADTEYCILTDEYLYFISQKSIGSSSTYIICYKEIASIYSSDDYDDLFFWDNAQNVLDLRTENTTSLNAERSLFYTPPSQGSGIVVNEIDGTQYRMYKSEYFDVVYCTIYAEKTTEEIVTTILIILAVLLAVYIVIYFITDKVTRIVFYPITKLLEYVSKEAKDEDFFDGEILSITAYIRKIQNKNLDLKKQLEQMTIKVREANNNGMTIVIPEEKELIAEKDVKIADDDQIKEKLAKYVVDHISEDIGLRDIADYFGLSFAYMSTLFKNKVEMNFKEYISYQRYLYSLDIMQENPKMKIAEVAERVGISNLNTFIRIFKKYNDLTPKQYMSMIENKLKEEKE